MNSIKDFFINIYGMLFKDNRLLWSLSLNDFKTKFAGSYFGIIWAFVQPICTILVFWFVFQLGFKTQDVGNVPYVLWLMTGLIPWFFFSEAWNTATNAFIEYSYLVKKIVFKINILPVIKIISALFVHLFFILFMLVVYACYGVKFDMYVLQIFYYGICMITLVTVLSFITAPLVVFFKDLTQIMNIILQFGMWLTPIMWNIDTIEISDTAKLLFKLNPMYYIVQGYRDSLIYKNIFFFNIKQTIYFWLLIIIFAFIGGHIYKKLKPHFADVL